MYLCVNMNFKVNNFVQPTSDWVFKKIISLNLGYNIIRMAIMNFKYA